MFTWLLSWRSLQQILLHRRRMDHGCTSMQKYVSFNILNIFYLFFLLMTVTKFSDKQARNISDKKKIVCYYPNWSMGFKGTAKVVPEDIDPTLCTHIIYAFSELGENNTIGSVDSNLDITQSIFRIFAFINSITCILLSNIWFSDGFTRFTDLKKHNKDLKALIGIGGSEEGPKALSSLVSTPNRRAAFKKNAVTFLRNYNFDGLDMDWQFPKTKDKVNFVQFMKVNYGKSGTWNRSIRPLKYLLMTCYSLGIKRRIRWRIK